MTSAVDVANMALAHIGAESQVASLDPPDSSAEAGYCARFLPIARRIAIESQSWTFAKKRATLAQVDNPSTAWAYAYALPSDHINPVRVLNQAALQSALLWVDSLWLTPNTPDYWRALLENTEQASALYEIEGQTLLTHEPDAVLIYLRDVTDVNSWSPMFTSAVAQLLAGYLAGPIIKGMEGMRVGKAWTDSGMSLLSRAAASDANATSERADFVPPTILARA